MAYSATISYWVKTTISGTSTGIERIFVYLYDNNTSSTYTVANTYFSTTMNSWLQYSFSIPSTLFGHSLVLGFNAKSSTTATTIRVDDVSLTYVASPGCTYSISPSSISPTSSSGGGSVSVSATQGCSWTAVSNNTSWLTVTSGSSGNGNGTVNYSYTANGTASSRTGTITIADKTFTVIQAGTTNNLLSGVDVSHWNGTINWSQVYAAKKKFAYVKATEGVNTNDAFLNPSMTSSNPNGVVLGAYHLARPDYSINNTATNEASHFLTITGSYIGAGYLPPALDIEGTVVTAYLTNHNISLLAIWINDWCNQIYTQTNIWPVLYGDRCNTAGPLYPYYQNGTINANIKLWIADYNHAAGSPGNSSLCSSTPWVGWPWLFHQYFAPQTASSNPVEFADPGMDQDVFNGTTTDFNNLINPSSSKADLTITAGTQSVSPTTVAAGSNITAYASEVNNGTAPAGANQVGLWLSPDVNLSTDNAVYLGAITGYTSLSPNVESIVRNASVNIPSNTPSGTYRLFFWADGGNCTTSSSTCSNCSGVINESNECNNFASVILNITCTNPGSVTVSGNGTFCNSATLTASGGSGGTIYWQGITDGGTSTAIPSTSQVVTSSGTYYFRAYNSCGWGIQGSATVALNNSTNNWTGAVSTAWENVGNWSCGVIPDANTDVIINSGTVIVNSNAFCRTLTIKPGVKFTTNAGYKFTIVH